MLQSLDMTLIKELEETQSGICQACGETRHGLTEPDAENYPCEACGKNKVLGPHWILMNMLDFLDFKSYIY